MSDWGILVPLAGIGIGGLAIWTRHQARLLEFGKTAKDDDGGKQAIAIRRLEERVQVLERIITDQRTGLAAEIEALREPARVGQSRD